MPEKPNPLAGGTPLVLASASRSRAILLADAGLAVSAVPAAIDEEMVKQSVQAEGGSAADAARTLARLKAERISPGQPGTLVVGADQMLACEGRWFDKPAGREGARDHLQALRGRTHSLFSAVAVVRDGALLWSHLAEAKLTMRDFGDDFLEAYLDAAGDEVCRSVGAYQLEGLGIQLFAAIDGDYFTILGLPLLPLLDFLRGHGVVRP